MSTPADETDAKPPDPKVTKPNDEPPPTPLNIDTVKTVLGLILAGFAAVTTFIGVTSTDISSALRNDPRATQVIFLTLLAAVVTALLGSLVTGGPKPLLGSLLALTLVGIAGGIFLTIVIPIPFKRISWSVFVAGNLAERIVCATLVAVALAILVWTHLDSLEPGHDYKNGFLRADLLQLDSLLIIASVILLGISVFGAVRIESVIQGNASVQLSASSKEAGSDADISLAASASRLPEDAYILLSLKGAPRPSETDKTCSEDQHRNTTNGSSKSCVNMCTGKSDGCQSITTWRLYPDVTGAVKQLVAFPISAVVFEEVTGTATICYGSNAFQSSTFSLVIAPPESG